MKSRREFGFLQEAKSYRTDSISILPSPKYEAVIAGIWSGREGHDGWFYPPVSSGSSSTATRFSLPNTHSICTSDSSDKALSEFLITIFGWIKGLRLTPDGWGHFYRVAVKPGELTDFIVSDKDVIGVLNLVEKFWYDTPASETRQAVFAAVHWYLFAFSYAHDFERFMSQYMVLDTINRATELVLGNAVTGGHSRRAMSLAESWQLQTPSWAIVRDKRSLLSEIRNALVHESRIGSSPVGFGYTDEFNSVLLGLEAFNCRLIASVLGIQGAYTRSNCETRQRHRLSID